MNFSRERTAEGYSRFLSVLDAEGLRPALAELLMRTDYRFIAVFRFNGDWANAAMYFDRENPGVLGVAEVPASATYCVFAHQERTAFVTENSMEDARLEHHVAREQVRAYCGVPIMTPEGEVLGTLCHYDLVPRDTSQIDLALMCEIASTLERRKIVPAYPAAA